MLARYQPQEVNGLTKEFNLGYDNRNCQQKCCQFCLDSAATVQYKLQWQRIKSGICPVEVIYVSPVSLAAWCKFFGNGQMQRVQSAAVRRTLPDAAEYGTLRLQ